MTDLKYLTSFSIPIVCIIGLYFQDIWAFLTPVFAFLLIPIIEILMPVNSDNLSETEEEEKSKNPFFDVLLYLNLPIVYGILGYFLHSLMIQQYSIAELVGLTFSVGIVVGSNGINVAHELGHRKSQFEKTLGKALLLPSLYMHFYIEHNFGHHKNMATAEDPATAKYNESVYAFWYSSIVKQYASAWKIQKKLLKRQQFKFLSLNNDMLWYVVFQITYLAVVFFTFGTLALGLAICIAITGALLLETINYIEHYGLSRNKTKSGRYERVSKIHSWNSNHVIGRMMLYELTRHSDHHFRAHKKYQILDYHDISPQMPYGYPTSMVLSLFPPVWFRIMNKRIPVEMRPESILLES